MAREELIFSDYLRVVLRHKWYVVVCLVLTLVLTYFLAGRETPVYESKTRIKIQRMMTFADMFDEVLVSTGDPIENYLYEITSYVVISGASAAISYPRPPVPEDISSLHQAVRAQKVERTDLIDISTRGSTPEESRWRGQAIVQAFIEHHNRTMASNAQDVYNSIKESRDSLIRGLKNQESELWKNLGPEIVTERDSTGEMSAMRTRLSELDLQLRALRASGNYKEEFPEIKSLKSQVQELQKKIDAVAEGEMDRQSQMTEYEHQKKITEEMGLFFARKLEEAKIASQKKSEMIQIIEPTGPGTAITRGRTRTMVAGALLGLMLGIIIAFMADSLDTSIRTLGEIEEMFGIPVLGVIPHFSPDTIDVPLHPERLVDKIKYSTFVTTAGMFWRAMMSTLYIRRSSSRSSGSKRRELIVPFAPRSPATEGYRILRTNIQMIMEKNHAKAFLVTSSGPAEGKSTTTSNLAMAFAQGGKRVLLIGANMRRPQMYRIFGLERDRGLSNILAGEVGWREVIKDFRDVALGAAAQPELVTAPGMDHLFFITAGGKTIHPAEWLQLPAFHQLLKEAKEEFDVVLVDGTPVLPVPDSVIIGQVADQVILVYQVGVASRESLRRALKSLRNVGATVSGLILNDVRSSWAEGADFHHYRGYYGKPEKTQ